MKQFSLEEYLKNPERKVVTRDGRCVRIISTDRKVRGDDFCVIGLIFHDAQTEDVSTFRRNGKYGITEDSCNDLFFAPEKHEGWVNVYRAPNGQPCTTTNVYATKEDAEEVAGHDKIATCKIIWED